MEVVSEETEARSSRRAETGCGGSNPCARALDESIVAIAERIIIRQGEAGFRFSRRRAARNERMPGLYQDWTELVHRHPAEAYADVLHLALPTYAILCGTWLSFAVGWSYWRGGGRYPKLQPFEKDERRGAWRWCVANWGGMFLLTPMAGPVLGVWFGRPEVARAPTLLQSIGTILVVFSVLDVYLYAMHRALHASRPLFKVVHSVRHRFQGTFPAVSFVAHPFQLVLEGLGAVLGLLVARAVLYTKEQPMPLVLVWTLLAVLLVHNVYLHCGYDVPMPLPFFVSARFRDRHHQFGGRGNFGGITILWDRLLGTEIVGGGGNDD